MAPAQMTLLAAIQQARDCMATGDLEQAIVAECKIMDLFKSAGTIVDARALAVSGAFQVTAADFLEPHSIPSDEELETTFAYVREHAELTTRQTMFQRVFMYRVLSITGPSTEIPDNVNPVITEEISLQGAKLEAMHEEERQPRGQENEEMEVDNEEKEKQERKEFEMRKGAWDAVYRKGYSKPRCT